MVEVKPMRLFIFRHGETDWNAEQRFQGHLDIPLNDRGRAQARRLVPQLRRQGIEAILSSDLSRALETASIVASELGIGIHQDPDIREAHLGEAQGHTREEIVAKFGEEIARRWGSSHLSDADVAYPGGESGSTVLERCFGAMERFMRAHSYRNVGVATHGGVIRRIMHHLLPPGSPYVPIPNGVLYLIRYEPARRAWQAETFMPLERGSI